MPDDPLLMIGHNQEQLAEALVTCIQHGQTAKPETKHTHKNRDRALFGKRNLQETPLAVEPTHKKTETGITTYEKRSVAALDLAPETSLPSTHCHRKRECRLTRPAPLRLTRPHNREPAADLPSLERRHLLRLSENKSDIY